MWNTLFMDDYVVRVSALRTQKITYICTLVQNGVCKFVENKIGIDRLRFSRMKNDTRGGIVYCAIWQKTVVKFNIYFLNFQHLISFVSIFLQFVQMKFDLSVFSPVMGMYLSFFFLQYWVVLFFFSRCCF